MGINKNTLFLLMQIKERFKSIESLKNIMPFTTQVYFKFLSPASSLCSNIIDQIRDLRAADGHTSGHRCPTHMHGVSYFVF